MNNNLRNDIPASIVVVFVAIPLCLGIALASGAPLFSGLIAGVVGGLVVGSISRSPLGVSGPAAGLAVIVLGAIQSLGSFDTFLLAVVLAGVFQIIMGIARAGTLGYFFPSSVIKGMLAGIGIIIVLKQIPHAFGYDKDPEGELSFVQPTGETTLSSLWRMLDNVEPAAVLITVIAMAMLILWDRVLSKKSVVFRILPGPLAAVIFGILYQVTTSAYAPSWALSPSHLVSVPVANSFEELSGLITMPAWSEITNSAVWVTAITIAVVASIETLLCVAATDKLDPQKRVTPTNRELLAQGVGNMASGLIGGLPVTQVIVRSSANIQSGGRTKISAILHGAWLLLFVALVPSVLNLVPLAVLASILFTVGYKLARPALFKQMWSLGASQFVPFIVTILGIALTDLLTGIGVGLAVAIFVILRRNYQNSHFLHIHDSTMPDERHLIRMRLSEEVTFLNKGAIVKELDAVPHGSIVEIDTSAAVVLDHDVLEVIEDFRDIASRRDIEVRMIHEQSDVPVPMRNRVRATNGDSAGAIDGGSEDPQLTASRNS
ncbi:MAG: SulP family inorganic anion transporter [bacterium]|nr:SulP family inorganic anion transporter [bacterium]